MNSFNPNNSKESQAPEQSIMVSSVSSVTSAPPTHLLPSLVSSDYMHMCISGLSALYDHASEVGLSTQKVRYHELTDTHKR